MLETAVQGGAASKPPRNVRAANAIDAHVGARVRQRRAELGVTQERLASMLGVAFQQIQKYERGINRISASRLYQIAVALEVPLEYFFRGLEDRPVSEGAAAGE